MVARDEGEAARFENVKADPSTPAIIFARLTSESPQSLRDLEKSWALPKGQLTSWFTTEHAGLHAAAMRLRVDASRAFFIRPPGLPKVVLPDGRPHCFVTGGNSLEFVAGYDERGPYITLRPHDDNSAAPCADCRPDLLI